MDGIAYWFSNWITACISKIYILFILFFIETSTSPSRVGQGNQSLKFAMYGTTAKDCWATTSNQVAQQTTEWATEATWRTSDDLFIYSIIHCFELKGKGENRKIVAIANYACLIIKCLHLFGQTNFDWDQDRI